MANNTLSEHWLLKELGDMHWELISRGLEKTSSSMYDNMGNRLYAAFVRISYAIHPLHEFLENEIFVLNSGNIMRFGNNAYISNLNGSCNNKYLEAMLMTNFSYRSLNDNSKIAGSKPEETINHIEQYTNIPAFLSDYRLVKRGLVDTVNCGEFEFKVTDETVTEVPYKINPYYDINGVGLIYFASYPIISDKCLLDYFTETGLINKWHSDYQTIHRDIFYYSNCNYDDTILFKLNTFEVLSDSRIKLSTSLYRKSDNAVMAKIFTVKQRVAGTV